MAAQLSFDTCFPIGGSGWINFQIFHFLLFLFRKTNFDWIQLIKPLDTSVQIFFHANIRIIHFKTVPGFVDIQFASWPNVMKKMKFHAENGIFL